MMARTTPVETMKRAAIKHGGAPLLQPEIRTGFRDTYSLSLPNDLIDLLKQLNKRVNLSRELEKPIRKAAARIARNINENRPKGRGLPTI